MTLLRRGGVLLLILSAVAIAQQPPSSPTALSYAGQSVAAMSGNNAVADATLTGTINTWMAGSTADTGTDVTGNFCTRWNERIHRGGSRSWRCRGANQSRS